jgi:hypothetical protein
VTDQRLRDLERDAARGDLHAQARLLLERVRVGDLTDERLRLAAYLGDEVACVALEYDPRRSVAMNGDWFRGLVPWSPALAAWALAEACAAQRRHEDVELLEQARLGLRTAFLSGAAATDVARSLPNVSPLSGTGVVKWLCLWWQCLREDGRRGRLDDPEIVRVLDDVRSRFEPHEVGDLSYAWSERRDGSWVHWVYYHLRRSGVEKGTTEVASAGWDPDSDAAPAGLDFLYDLNFSFADPEAAIAAVQSALLPWALAPRGSST